MTRRLPVLTLFALLGLAGARPAAAYSILSTNGYDSFRWPAGEPVPWTYDPAGSDDLPLDVVRSSLSAAFGVWDDVPCASVDFALQGPAFEPEKGRVHVLFEEEEWDPATQDAAALAETFRNSRDEIVRATIRFNGVDMRWTLGGDPFDAFVVDFQGVATHEIGHTVGLAHSRERQSAMFFAGGDTGGRELDADDERGLCFLYPNTPFTAGRPCDSCDAHNQCGGGSCLFFLEEGGYCGQDCDGGEDCPGGFVCQPVEGLPDQCVPTNGHCDERGGNIPVGDYCYGDVTCASGACLATPESAFCTEICDPEAPASCGDAVCVASGSTGLCIPPGPLPLGLPCASHADCSGTLCIETLSGGVCSQPCASDAACPDGARCMSEVCVPPGPRPLGGACQSHFDCASQTCVADPEGNAFCTQTCSPEAPCPDGAVCLNYGPVDYCHAAGKQPEGGPCRSTAGCREGLLCQPGDEEESWTFCARPCDATLDAPACAETQVCEWAPLPLVDGLPVGRCVANSGAAPGALCGPSEGACRRDLVCTLTTAWKGVCRSDCLLGDDASCPEGQRCWPLDRESTPGRGVCSWLEPPSGPVVWMPDDPLPDGVLEEFPIEAARVVAIEDAPPPPSSGACAATDAPSGRPWPVLALLLLLAILRGRAPRRVVRGSSEARRPRTTQREVGASAETSTSDENTCVA